LLDGYSLDADVNFGVCIMAGMMPLSGHPMDGLRTASEELWPILHSTDSPSVDSSRLTAFQHQQGPCFSITEGGDESPRSLLALHLLRHVHLSIISKLSKVKVMQRMPSSKIQRRLVELKSEI
jgi:hypothetical protein